ncbi:MAG: DUF3253 domain-containing protein [Acidimicrobiales bacterium]
MGAGDVALEEAIRALLDRLADGATICPKRGGVGGGRRRLASADGARLGRGPTVGGRREVEITQRGRVVDPSTAKGPIRIRRRRRA